MMLAHDWLYGPRVRTAFDSILTRHLELPTRHNPHSGVAVLNTLAERIVFTDDIPSTLYNMSDNKQLDIGQMIRSTRLPYDTFWIEYNSMIGIEDTNANNKDSVVKCGCNGALIQRMGDEAVRFFIVSGLRYVDRKQAVSTISYVVDFDRWPPVRDDPSGYALGFYLRYAFNIKEPVYTADTEVKYADELQELGNLLREFIFGIFLITQPRVYDAEQVKYKDSHKQMRKAQGKHPLLEHRRIRLHILKTHKHYAQRPATSSIQSIDTDSEAATQHRRYHKVMGHFRHYTNEKTQRSVWIEPHYRGDPALGVTFTERDVMR